MARGSKFEGFIFAHTPCFTYQHALRAHLPFATFKSLWKGYFSKRDKCPLNFRGDVSTEACGKKKRSRARAPCTAMRMIKLATLSRSGGEKVRARARTSIAKNPYNNKNRTRYNGNIKLYTTRSACERNISVVIHTGRLYQDTNEKKSYRDATFSGTIFYTRGQPVAHAGTE